jgi:hypothetical protein
MSGREYDEGANERVNVRATGVRGVKTMYRKRRLCAHQPVPWKRNKSERGAEESFLPDGRRQTYSNLERHGVR